jgi:hypothetical protein
MKRLLFISLLIFLLLQSQESISQPLQLQWQQCYGGSQDENGYNIAKTSTGFFLLGSTGSHDQQVPGSFGGSDFWVIRTDSVGSLIWTKTYGGSGDEVSTDMKPTLDGGYILFGYTFSEGNSGLVTGNHGGADYWLVKVDSLGNLEWQKCLGGSCNDISLQIVLTQDGGYLCIGYSCSNDGEITENHGSYDAWVVKVNSTGNIIWQKSFGGTQPDYGFCASSTSDGGAIIGCGVGASDGNIQCSFHGGDADVWVAKLDSVGNIEWQQCYGGSSIETIQSIIKSNDGGYIFCGFTYSNDGDVSGNHGNGDIWIVKLDQLGTLEWQKCFGGSQDDAGFVIKKSTENEYLIGGLSYSNDGDVSGNHNPVWFTDMWIFKISSNGSLLWQQCLGGEGDDAIHDFLDLKMGRLMLFGDTHSGPNSGDVSCNSHGWGTYDYWLVSTLDTTFVLENKFSKQPFEVETIPNPADQSIEFISKQPNWSSNTIIRYFNQLGQNKGILILQKGESNVSLDSQNLPSGTYFYTYSNKDFNGAGKIIIIH